MEKNKLEKLYEGLQLCAVFHKVVKAPLLQAFSLYAQEDCKPYRYGNYAAFVAEIYKQGDSLTELVQKLLFEDENVYIQRVAAGQEVGKHLLLSAKRELRLFSEFASLTPRDFAQDMGISVEEIPTFSSFNADMGALYEERLAKLPQYGYGIFSACGMFRLSEEKEIEPIVSADQSTLSRFIGYERERQAVIDNTLAFLAGRPAANALLCGDAGAGKSSTVKAVANAFFDRGLRLIELRKDQLRYLPLVMGKINGNPLKFIIFIDDLSFYKNNDDFSMLKAALEGSASAKAKNAVIYATSNRRHIVKESFSEREGDDIHRNDTMQETLSLSERFGLTVLFSKPNKEVYLTIVKGLAKRYGVTMKEEELEVRAEAFALKKGNRSARCAEQFIDSLR